MVGIWEGVAVMKRVFKGVGIFDTGRYVNGLVAPPPLSAVQLLITWTIPARRSSRRRGGNCALQYETRLGSA